MQITYVNKAKRIFKSPFTAVLKRRACTCW